MRDRLAVGAGVEIEVVEASRCGSPSRLCGRLKPARGMGQNRSLRSDRFHVHDESSGCCSDQPRRATFTHVQRDHQSFFVMTLTRHSKIGVDVGFPCRRVTGGMRVIIFETVQAKAHGTPWRIDRGRLRAV